jgi:DNA-binding NarL/FixJ family response regulator
VVLATTPTALAAAIQSLSRNPDMQVTGRIVPRGALGTDPIDADVVVTADDGVEPSTSPDLPADPELLTRREHQVLEYLAEGLGNKIIAARMGISVRTVKFYVGRLLEKLGVQSRTEAVTAGLRRGLILL